MYRPEGWEETKRLILEEPNGMDKWCCSVCGDKIVDLTADAMLEALKKNNSVICSINGRDIPLLETQGQLVFIPEGEDD